MVNKSISYIPFSICDEWSTFEWWVWDSWNWFVDDDWNADDDDDSKGSSDCNDSDFGDNDDEFMHDDIFSFSINSLLLSSSLDDILTCCSSENDQRINN